MQPFSRKTFCLPGKFGFARLRLPRAIALTVFVLTSGSGTAFARPDFSGPWEIEDGISALKTIDGKAPSLTPEGEKLWHANQAAAGSKSDPLKACLPPGIPRVMIQKGFAFNFVVGKDLAGMFFEWNHLPRPIYMDIDHFENIGPTYLGQSVGKWDGDTLVVDTAGFNDVTWLDNSGLPHTEDLRTVERIWLKDKNTLQDQITFTDPKIFQNSWTALISFKKHPGYRIKEDWCLRRMGLVK